MIDGRSIVDWETDMSAYNKKTLNFEAFKTILILLSPLLPSNLCSGSIFALRLTPTIETRYKYFVNSSKNYVICTAFKKKPVKKAHHIYRA